MSESNSTCGTSPVRAPQAPSAPALYLGDDLIAVRSGARIPGVSTETLKLMRSVAVNERWRIGAQLVAYSSICARGNENNLHQAGTTTDLNGNTRTFLGPGYAPGYAALNLSTRYNVLSDLEFFARISNLFNHPYATAGAQAENPFNAAGEFQTDPQRWQREIFDTPGAPRAAWIGLRYRF